jgi:hypothetical protein
MLTVLFLEVFSYTQYGAPSGCAKHFDPTGQQTVVLSYGANCPGQCISPFLQLDALGAQTGFPFIFIHSDCEKQQIDLLPCFPHSAALVPLQPFNATHLFTPHNDDLHSSVRVSQQSPVHPIKVLPNFSLQKLSDFTQ